MRRIYIILIAVGAVMSICYYLTTQTIFFSPTVEAVGDLLVDFGAFHTNSPLFTLKNIAPGQTITKSVYVENTSGFTRSIGLRGMKTDETGGMAQALSIVIKEHNRFIYGGSKKIKTLAEFFSEASGPNGMYLSYISKGKNTRYSISIEFIPAIGNEFQNKKLSFDLQIGISIPLPSDCEKLHLSGKPIYGTSGHDRINGTEKNDLIIALEGDDIVQGKGGDDCIVGGSGKDIVHGGHGRDRCEGEKRIDCEL